MLNVHGYIPKKGGGGREEKGGGGEEACNAERMKQAKTIETSDKQGNTV